MDKFQLAELKCPLTGNNNALKLVKIIPVKDLIAIYKRLHNVDISREFQSEEISLYENESKNFFFFYPFKSGSSAFYDNLAQDSYYNSVKEEFAFAAKYVSPKLSVLDVGCGWGAFRDYVPQAIYKGLEFSQKSISKCLEKRIDVSSKTIQELAQKDLSYDIVTAFQVLEHVEDPVGFTALLKKVTKENGLIIISVPNVDSSVVLENKPLNFPPHHITWWSKDALLFLGQKLNLELIDIDIAKSKSLRPFFAVLLKWKIDRLLGREHRLISNSRISAFLYKVLFLIGKLFNDAPSEIMPNGHSLTVIFKKKKQRPS